MKGSSSITLRGVLGLIVIVAGLAIIIGLAVPLESGSITEPTSSQSPSAIPVSLPTATDSNAGPTPVVTETKVAHTATPTDLATSGDWKTYVNTHGQYRYSYPPDWQSQEPCPTFTGPECGEGPQNRSALQAPAAEYPNGFFAVEYHPADICDAFTSRARSWNWQEVGEGEEVIAGDVAATVFNGMIEFADGQDYIRKYILLRSGDTCYILDSWRLPASNYGGALDQILLSFELLN